MCSGWPVSLGLGGGVSLGGGWGLSGCARARRPFLMARLVLTSNSITYYSPKGDALLGNIPTQRCLLDMLASMHTLKTFAEVNKGNL